jgi:hypothetical protein
MMALRFDRQFKPPEAAVAGCGERREIDSSTTGAMGARRSPVIDHPAAMHAPGIDQSVVVNTTLGHVKKVARSNELRHRAFGIPVSFEAPGRKRAAGIRREASSFDRSRRD